VIQSSQLRSAVCRETVQRIGAFQMAKFHPARGLVTGIAGGFIATIVMTGFQSIWRAAGKRLSAKDAQKDDGGEFGQGGQSGEQKENPTVKVAAEIAKTVGADLTPSQSKTGGTLVHYGFGTSMGALYGLALEGAQRRHRAKTVATGLIFGSTLFAVADEIALPTLGLADKPTQTPATSHLYGLASHLVYGLTAAFVTQRVRRWM
jgi:putative membrane protein